MTPYDRQGAGAPNKGLLAEVVAALIEASPPPAKPGSVGYQWAVEAIDADARAALAAAGRVLAAEADERNDLTADDIRRLCGLPSEGAGGGEG